MSVVVRRGPIARAMARARARSQAKDVIDETATPVEYVGLTTRAIAFVIDAAVIFIVGCVVAAGATLTFAVLDLPEELKKATIVIGGIASVLWAAGYFIVFWSLNGQTPGARVMRFRVCDVSGTGVLPRRALVRCAGLVLAALPLFLGYAVILVSDRRRGLHDWLARTVVIDYEDPATRRPRRRE